ncbi:MAG: M3 family oligoendopeptidase [Clostridiales bacterium]|jgi:pepF/M3 family oligoendopeptidase|nr:M3 family oligoendopeptidase [Clostridiales bacterium]
MGNTWSLNELYSSFESAEFIRDLKDLSVALAEIKQWTETNLKTDSQPKDAADLILNFIKKVESLERFHKMVDYANLVLAVDCENAAAMKMFDRVNTSLNELSGPNTVFRNFLSGVKDWETAVNDPKLAEYYFVINEMRDESKYLLTEKEEILLARLRGTGSDAWQKLWEQLTGTLMVRLVKDGKETEQPLTVIRNLANSPSAAERKIAYEAELKSYENIDTKAAAALNSIKGEANTESDTRGYKSVLEMTLLNARMDERILNSMFGVMKEYLPHFARYFRHKAKLLGHKDGLPFYDLFAPVGESKSKYTYPEAAELVFEVFGDFSESLRGYAKNAYDNNWIDVLPHEGKVGGAFCSSVNDIRETRILLNFGGNFDDVMTMAHELGHGYHDHCMKTEKFMNRGYSMPIAETASTFCETMLANHVLKNASKAEALYILEKDIMESGQVIVDIYSRFLFEDEVINRRREGVLSAPELKDIMIRAQKAAYGSGLDSETLHPYMWVCKPHYYYVSSNYYNFPYAYGLLFAKGLYSQYLADKGSFPKKYRQMLANTGKMNLRDVGKYMGIDVADPAFWKSSLEIIKREIDQFCSFSEA